MATSALNFPAGACRLDCAVQYVGFYDECEALISHVYDVYATDTNINGSASSLRTTPSHLPVLTLNSLY